MFFLWIILGIIVFCIMIACSTIKIEIRDLRIYLPKQNGRYINKEYKIIIKLYILKKIKILNLCITNTILERRKINNKIQMLEQKLAQNKDKFDIEFWDVVKALKIEIEGLKLKIYLGTEDAAITAILIGLISSILGFFIGRKINNLTNVEFETIPIYQDKNFLKMYFEGIFKINMIHIIYIIYILKKKGRVDKNVRTSNRRAYAYSNE